MYKPKLKNILVIGGGDGGTLTEILKHEKFQTDERRRAGLDKFEYDLIIKTRSDVIFRHPGCYKYNHEYTKIKKDYYFSAPSSHDSIDNGYVKCNALRFMDFEDVVFNSGSKTETIITAFLIDISSPSVVLG